MFLSEIALFECKIDSDMWVKNGKNLLLSGNCKFFNNWAVIIFKYDFHSSISIYYFFFTNSTYISQEYLLKSQSETQLLILFT